MALKYPDRIESNNPQAYGIVKATEVSGAKNTAEYGGLLSIPDNILSANGDGSDALYLLWIDDNLVYRLVDWNNRHNDKGWLIEYAYIPWDTTAHLNSFTLSGQYYLTGQSNGLDGGLPILNSDPGHTFDSVLRVLDSSLTKDADLKLLCITLILSLSNRMGGDGHIFVRTIQTLERDNLTRNDIESPTCDRWGTWEKLLGIFEKNAITNITDLDGYTTNGMYSGIYTNTSSQELSGVQFNPGDTFLLITVNGYAASAFGTQQLTQLLYKLPVKHDSEPYLAQLYVRTAHWLNDAWYWGMDFLRLVTSFDLDNLKSIETIKINGKSLTVTANKEVNFKLKPEVILTPSEVDFKTHLVDANNNTILQTMTLAVLEATPYGAGIAPAQWAIEREAILNVEGLYKHIDWSTSLDVNTLVTAGNYRITGIRTSTNDNLPMLNAASGHSIDCYLKVLDSSLKPDNGSSITEACVTLILTTSNRVGGDGHVYVRTGQSSEGGYNNLTWSTWLCLQGIFEKNVVELPVHLNTYTTNGMYSGIFVNPDRVGDLQIKAFDTFLLITVNGYAAAGAALIAGLNKAPQLTQLLYITPIETGLANLYTRTATWDGSLWVFGKFYRLATNEDTDKLNTEISNLLTKDAELDELITSVQTTADNAQTRNDKQDERLKIIEENLRLSAAGRYWNEANGTPTAAGHYGSLDALRSLPEKLGLGRYLVKDDRTRRKLDPKDSTKYADDGTTAKLDGTDGQCMWCWNGFYANVWKEGDNLFKVVSFDRPVGNDISIWIPAGGISWLGAGVIDRGDAPYTDKTKWKLCSVINNSEQFRGGGGAALDASKFTKAPADTTPQITMLGMPATNISTTDFGNYARKRGEGWEANWFVARFVVEFLFEVIMGTENSQEAFNNLKDADGLYQGGFGTGVTDMPDWGGYNGTYPVIPTSVGLEAGDGVCLVSYNLPDASGGTYKTFNVPVFFGLVGAGYGHLWKWVRGLIMDAGEEKSMVYVAPSMYASYDPNTVAGKIMVAECPRVSGWITRKSYKGLCCMPTEIGGSNTLRYSDQFSTNAETSKGLRIRAAGGGANYGTGSGASYTSAGTAAMNAVANYSAPLCYFAEDPVIPDSQSIANNS